MNDAYACDLLYDTGKSGIRPVFSICLLSYKQGHTISYAIESALSQETRVPYELIVMDDCSPDDTCDLILGVLQRCQITKPCRVRFFRAKENGGILWNRLRCYDKAEGEWLVNADGDDLSLPSRLESTYQVISGLKCHPSLIRMNGYRVSSATDVSQASFVFPREKRYLPGSVDAAVDNPIGGAGAYVLHVDLHQRFRDCTPQFRIICDDSVISRRALLLDGIYFDDTPVFRYVADDQSVTAFGVSGRKWIHDRLLRWQQLEHDIKYISPNHKIPSEVAEKLKYWIRRTELTENQIDCPTWIWPYHWLRLALFAPSVAIYHIRYRIKLLLLGSVEADFCTSRYCFWKKRK